VRGLVIPGRPWRPPRRRGGTKLRTLVWLAVAVAAVGLALAGHELLWSDQTPPEPAPPKKTFAPSVPRMGSRSPKTWAMDPMNGIGLSKLAEDPPDAVIYPGAVRHSGFRRQTPDGVEDIIVYLPEAKAADVAAFYRDRLAEAGYKLMRAPARQADAGGIMVFLGAEREVYRVMLRSADNGKKVKITLVIARPEPSTVE